MRTTGVRAWGSSILVVGLLLAWAAARGAEPAGGVSGSYLAGLDALAAGKWADAIAAFDKCIDADEENTDYLTARGVARVLAKQFPAGIKDLQRSLRMQPAGWEAKLWLWAAYNMNGDPGTGAQYTVHGPTGRQATKGDLDYSNFVYTMSHNYWDASTHGQYRDYKTGKTLTAADIEAADFARAAGLFVERRRGGLPQPAGAALLDRVKANLQGRQYAAALKDLDSLLTGSPEDDNLLLLRADAELALGDYSGSRADYTHVLTDQPGWAAGYVGRAMAAAHLADAARAHRDLAIAEKLGAKEVRPVGQAVTRVLAVIPTADPAEAVARLAAAARAGEGEPKLVPLALGVVQSVNPHRLRYDETYQDQLRVLDEALRADPKNPDRIADLADFLFAESNPPFEQVETRGWPVYYRYVPQAVPKVGRAGEILPAPPVQRTAREVARASGLVDEALAANPNHVRSLGLKGAILNSLGQYAQARDILDKAVALKPNDPVLLHDRSVALQAIARADQLAAEALRMPKISTSYNPDGSSTTTTIYPSAADLARAAALEREANECHQKAVEDMTKAQKLTAGTAMGAYYQGFIDYAYHNTQQAQSDFQQAVKLDPKFRDAWEQLAKVDLELNLPEEWAAAKSAGLNLVQTTAGPWLVAARTRIVRTQWKSGREALSKARELDPADARIEAYSGVIDAANDKADEALAHYRIAIALEEARNLLRGRDLGQGPGAEGAPAIVPSAQDIGLTLALRNRAGALLFQRGQAELASGQFGANMAFLKSLRPEDLAADVARAVLPSGVSDPGSPPLNETYAGLKARSQAGLDYTAWARRYGDPKDVALAAETFFRLVVDFQVTDPNPVVLQAVINLGLAELEAAKGQWAAARELLRNEGATPQPLWQEMRRVEAQINQHR